MTLNDFIAKWLGQQVDWDGHFGYQCVDLFRLYCRDVLGVPQPGALGNAGAVNFWHNYPNDPNLHGSFDQIKNTPAGVPNYGDVIIWGNVAGGLGHIAIFLSGDANSFTSLDQNWGHPKVEKVHHDYTHVLGWLRPKDQTPI